MRSLVALAVEEVSGVCVPADSGGLGLEDLNIDSLGLIEVGMIVEEGLGIVLAANDFDGVVTFDDAVAVFERAVELLSR